MNSIFNLPHIFIVFNPGSGGNFLAGIFNKLLNSNLQSINIARDGSSHTLVNNKVTGTDFLSFGTLIEEHEPFKTEEDREQFYLTNIKQKYSDITEPQVIWTHDFTNIPLYRKHFKNAKILVITNNTDHERLTSIIMNITKTLLGTDAAIPLSKDVWQHALDRWYEKCMPELCKLVTMDHAKEILADRLNPNNKKILEYVSIEIFLRYYRMSGLIEQEIAPQQLFNNVLYPIRNSTMPYKVGKTQESYIVDNCVVLPYNYLLNNDVDLLIAKIAELFDRTISQEEQDFIKESFFKYRNAQNQTLLSDPVKYYNDLKNKVT